MADGKLTAKQELFCKEYLVDLNATQAAIRAGYSAKTAQPISSELLSKPIISARIQGGMDKRAEKTEITAEEVLTSIHRIAKRCEQAEPVVDKEGMTTGEYKFEASAALKAYELLGKHLVLFTDKQELTGRNGGAIEVRTMSDILNAISGKTTSLPPKPTDG